MNLSALIKNPQNLDRDSLYELRSLLALYPYYQTARLLMLQNLYLLHDPMFDEELRVASVYITNRKVLFQMVEAAHYQLQRNRSQSETRTEANSNGGSSSRTISLINHFLDTIPVDEEATAKPKTKSRRKPTPADAAVDYVAYLIECDEEENEEETNNTSQLKGQSLIDNFIKNDRGKIVLNETPEYLPQISNDDSNAGLKEGEEGYFTETLARIYIKQGRYSKALEIIRRLSLNYPKKNAYFADQIRFLEKLIANSKGDGPKKTKN